MKKNLSVFLSTLFVAGCGCGTEPEVYSHPTGLPEGPKGDYGTNDIELPVYNYIKNEADLMAGLIDPDQYCEAENLLFPSNFVHLDDCLDSDLVKYYDDILDNQDRLKAKLLPIVARVQDANSEPLVFNDLDVYVDYSGLTLNPDYYGENSSENTVTMGGIKIEEIMSFDQDIETYRQGLEFQFEAEYDDTYSFGIKAGTNDEFVVSKEIEIHEVTFEMMNVNSAWIISEKI